MFRIPLVIMILLLLMDHGNAKESAGSPTEDPCFCDGGCYRNPHMKEQIKCCRDICEEMDARSTTKECFDNCPKYHTDQIKKLKDQLEELRDSKKRLNLSTIEELRICHVSKSQAETKIKELTQENDRVQCLLTTIKTWVPVGFLLTILVASLVFAFIMKRKLASLSSNNSSSMPSLDPGSQILHFQKNHWNELNNARYPNFGYSGNSNQNNNHPSDSSCSSCSSLTPSNHNTSVSETNSPHMVVRNQHHLSSLPTPHGHLDLTHPRRQHSLPENHEHQIELLKFPQYRLEARPHSPIPRMGTTAGPQPGRGRESPSCRRYGSGILYLGRQQPSLRDVTTPPLKCPMDYGDKKDNNNNPSAARERLEFREPPATRAEPRNACVDQCEDEDTTATCAKTMARYKQ